MRPRIWTFAVLVALFLAANLALLSLRIAQTGEDTIRARVASASSALRAHIELLDARLNPKAVANLPDLIEAARAAEGGGPQARPDERALRAAASVLQPEPDLLAISTGQGGIVSRRGKAAQQLDDPNVLPLAKTAIEGHPPPAFAQLDNTWYRVAAARIPGTPAVAVVGAVVDDRLAAQLRSQIDADVTLLQAGKILASSLPLGEERTRLLRWAAAPGPGYGTLPVRLPLVGSTLSGRLPLGAPPHAVRGALVALDSGVQATVTVPASPYFAWLARYQALYLAGAALLVLFGFVWALFAPKPRAPQPVQRARPAPGTRVPTPHQPMSPVPRQSPPPGHGDVSDVVSGPRPRPRTRDVPWSPGEGPSGELPVVHDNPPGRGAASEPAAKPDLAPQATAVFAAAAGGSAAPIARGVPSRQFESLDPEVAAEHATHPSGAAAEVPAGGSDDPFAAPPAGSGLQEAGYNGADADSAWGTATGPAAEQEPGGFPGDEPTRVEGISAALLDKMREKDEAPGAGAQSGLWDMPAPAPSAEAAQAPESPELGEGWGAPAPSAPAPVAAEGLDPSFTPPNVPQLLDPSFPPPGAGGLDPSFPPAAAEGLDPSFPSGELPGEEPQDPDLPHWQETFERFKALKTQLGEPADRISFDKFSAKLRKNREDLVAKHQCRGVRFVVYEKDGKAAIKASAIR